MVHMPREHTPLENGCSWPRFTDAAVLWAVGEKDHPFLFPFSIAKVCWGWPIPVPAQCTYMLLYESHVSLAYKSPLRGVFFYYDNEEMLTIRQLFSSLRVATLGSFSSVCLCLLQLQCSPLTASYLLRNVTQGCFPQLQAPATMTTDQKREHQNFLR